MNRKNEKLQEIDVASRVIEDDHDVIIKRLEQKDSDLVRSLYTKTFVEDGKGFVDHYFDHYVEMENVVGMTDKSSGELMCMAHLNPYQVMWQGQLYDTSYVVAVATQEGYRRKGYMRSILSWILSERYAEGEVFTLLMPIDSRYYDQFGFGFIQDVMVYKFFYKNISPLKMPMAPRPVQEVRRPDGSCDPRANAIVHKEIGPRDAIELLPIYNHYKRQFDLSHNRGMRALDMLVSEAHSEGGKVVMVPDGYVVYYDHETVFVRESCYVSSEGFYNILHYIGGVAGDKAIEWQMPKDNPLQHIVPHLEGHSRVNKPFMMARIVNVLEILRDMAELIGDSTIKVTDGQIFDNNATYRIVGSNVERVVLQGDEEADIAIDVESLGQWLFGYESLENLAFVRASVSVNRDVIYYPETGIKNYFNEFV